MISEGSELVQHALEYCLKTSQPISLLLHLLSEKFPSCLLIIKIITSPQRPKRLLDNLIVQIKCSLHKQGNIFLNM